MFGPADRTYREAVARGPCNYTKPLAKGDNKALALAGEQAVKAYYEAERRRKYPGFVVIGTRTLETPASVEPRKRAET